MPAIALPIVVVAHFDGRFSGRDVRELIARYAPPRHAPAVLAAVALVVVALYSNWPPDPAGVTGFLEGLLYWLDRGESGSAKVTFYVDRLIGATPGLAALAAVGTVGTLVRTDSSWLRWLFVSWGGIATAVLSLIADQSWYNVILVFPPVAVLAGCGAHDAYLALRRASELAFEPPVAPAIDAARAVAPVALALLLVTAGVTLPNLTADTDDLGEQEVAGLTTTGEDVRERVYLFARDRAADADCPVLIGPNEYGWPGPWWLRDSEFGRVDEWDDGYGPAVVVNRGPIPALEERAYDRYATEDGNYRVYVPEEGCPNG